MNSTARQLSACLVLITVALCVLGGEKNDSLIDRYVPPVEDQVRVIRTLGGRVVDNAKYNFTVLIFTYYKDEDADADDKFYVKRCTGSIISPKHVLTAAHCAMTFSNTDEKGVHKMKFGHHFRINAFDITSFKTSTVYVKRGYNVKFMHSDVAVLELEGRDVFDIEPVRLVKTLITGAFNVTLLGFGDYNVNSDMSKSKAISSGDNHLRSNTIPMYTSESCEAYMKRLKVFICDKFCGGAFQNGVLSGDSGGPLLYRRDDGVLFQVAVTSFKNSKDHFRQDEYPSGFTRIGVMCPWINVVSYRLVQCFHVNEKKFPKFNPQDATLYLANAKGLSAQAISDLSEASNLSLFWKSYPYVFLFILFLAFF